MSNLIIKPTAGGSLIFQDEGGTPAITIDASGNSTLASLSSATTFTPDHSINHQVSTDNTRRGLSSAAGWQTFYSFSYNKTVASSDIVVTSMIPCFDDAAGVTGIGFKYNTTPVWCGHYTYNDQGYGLIMMIHGVLRGHTTTGAQTLYLGWQLANAAASNPAVVYCPNATDDSRWFQTIASTWVYELIT